MLTIDFHHNTESITINQSIYKLVSSTFVHTLTWTDSVTLNYMHQ